MIPETPEIMEYENARYLFYFMKWRDSGSLSAYTFMMS